MLLKTLGRYEIVKPLGQGAMGVVYEAHDPNINRSVAIKTIRIDQLSTDMAAEFEARFRCETQAGGRLQHPNIIGVYDAGRDQGLAFMVMELVRGGDLRQQLVPGQPQPFERAMNVMKELLSALHFAHEQGIIHRDIKPANVMLDLHGRVKLGDFGVAQMADVELDPAQAPGSQASTVGTLKYLSPEQVSGASIDARADLFAAGVVMYQLLTGTKPFEGDSDFAVMQAIVHRDPARPTALNVGLPAGIDAVVFKALAKDRDHRYASARDFALALRTVTQQTVNVQTSVPPRRLSPAVSAVAKLAYDDEATRLARPVDQIAAAAQSAKAALAAEQIDKERRAAQAARDAETARAAELAAQAAQAAKNAEITRKAEELRRAQAHAEALARKAELAERARLEAQAATMAAQAQARAEVQKAEQTRLAELAAREHAAAAAAAAIELARTTVLAATQPVVAAPVPPLPVAPATERGNGRVIALTATIVLLGGGAWFATRDTTTPASRPPVAKLATPTPTPTVAVRLPVPAPVPEPITESVALIPIALTKAASAPSPSPSPPAAAPERHDVTASAASSRQPVPVPAPAPARPASTQTMTAVVAPPAPPKATPPSPVTQPAPVAQRPDVAMDSAAVAAPAPAAPVLAPAPAPAPEPVTALAKPSPAELFDRGQKLESKSLRQAETAYRDAAQQGHGASQKRLWELLLKAGRETEAIRYQREAWDQKVPGVPEPRSAIRL